MLYYNRDVISHYNPGAPSSKLAETNNAFKQRDEARFYSINT